MCLHTILNVFKLHFQNHGKVKYWSKGRNLELDPSAVNKLPIIYMSSLSRQKVFVHIQKTLLYTYNYMKKRKKNLNKNNQFTFLKCCCQKQTTSKSHQQSLDNKFFKNLNCLYEEAKCWSGTRQVNNEQSMK